MFSRRQKCRWVTGLIFLVIVENFQLPLFLVTTQNSSCKWMGSPTPLIPRFWFASVLVFPGLNQLFANDAEVFWRNLCRLCLSCQQAKPHLTCSRSAMWCWRFKKTTRTNHSRQWIWAAKSTVRMKQFVQINQPAVFSRTPPSQSLLAKKVHYATGQKSTNFMQKCSMMPLVLTLTILRTWSLIPLMMNWSLTETHAAARWTHSSPFQLGEETRT